MNVLMIGAGDIAKPHGRAVVKLGGKVIAALQLPDRVRNVNVEAW